MAKVGLCAEKCFVFVWLRKTSLCFFYLIAALGSSAPDYLPATRKKSKQMTQNICLGSENFVEVLAQNIYTKSCWLWLSRQGPHFGHKSGVYVITALHSASPLQFHVKLISHDCSKQGLWSLICSNLGSVSRGPRHSESEFKSICANKALLGSY